MLILEAQGIKKYFGDRLILAMEELKVYLGDRYGIIGRNGAGKTTLLNILAGELEPDEGFVRHYSDITYIRQFSQEDIQADSRLLSEFNLNQKRHQKVFSGGEQTRIRIANAFSRNSLLVFADEPTSNLDYKGVELFRQKLSEAASFLLISHDRRLLDSLCNKILEIRDGAVHLYNGNYSFFREQRDLERRKAEMDYEQYISEKTRLETAIRDRKDRAGTIRKAPARMGNSEARLHKRAGNEKQEKLHHAANSLKTRLEKLEVKEKPRDLPPIRMDFSLTCPPESKIVISASHLSFGYGSKTIFQDAGFEVPNRSKTALWGENGTGKTTLLNLIYDRSKEAIRVAPRAVLGYFHQGLENLDPRRTVLENVMKDSIQSETVVRTILARLLITGDAVHKKVEVLSGGERMKVSFAKLILSRINVLLMDEPTNYLDMNSMEALEGVMKSYEGTVVFVSHDSAFVNAVADRLLVLEEHRIKPFEGTLDEYRAALEKKNIPVASEMEKMMLQMKLSEIIARMNVPKADKEALEAEYDRLLAQLKAMNENG